MKKQRFSYALAALALLGAEACIALFVRDAFVRPYLGDVLVVVLIHCAVRVVFPTKPRLLPVFVFAFACLVELSQHLHLLDAFGISSRLLHIVIGGTFDWRDVLCYGAGCAIVLSVQELFHQRRARFVK